MGVLREGYEADFVITNFDSATTSLEQELDLSASVNKDKTFEELDEKYEDMVESTWVLGRRAAVWDEVDAAKKALVDSGAASRDKDAMPGKGGIGIMDADRLVYPKPFWSCPCCAPKSKFSIMHGGIRASTDEVVVCK